VRGGRVVRVVKAHRVLTSTRSKAAVEDQPERQKELGWVFAEEGDLALEIVACKKSKIIGYTYFSGPAMQLNQYTPWDEDWFEDAGEVALVEIPHPAGNPEEFFNGVAGQLMTVKYADETLLSAFRYRCRKRDVPSEVADAFFYLWRYEDKERTASGHLVGVVEDHKGPKKRAVTLDFQPPHHAADQHATGFQIELAIKGAEWAQKAG